MAQRGFIPLLTVAPPYSGGEYVPLPSARSHRGPRRFPNRSNLLFPFVKRTRSPQTQNVKHTYSPAGRGTCPSPTLTPNSTCDGDRANTYGRPWTSPFSAPTYTTAVPPTTSPASRRFLFRLLPTALRLGQTAQGIWESERFGPYTPFSKTILVYPRCLRIECPGAQLTKSMLSDR